MNVPNLAQYGLLSVVVVAMVYQGYKGALSILHIRFTSIKELALAELLGHNFQCGSFKIIARTAH